MTGGPTILTGHPDGPSQRQVLRPGVPTIVRIGRPDVGPAVRTGCQPDRARRQDGPWTVRIGRQDGRTLHPDGPS